MRMLLCLCILACVSSESAFSQVPLSDKRYDADIRASVSRWWVAPEWLWWKAQLYQESRFDPDAASPVGATGLAQFMPATWAEMQRRLNIPGVPANHARHAIDAGAYYMASLQRQWSSPRPAMDRHFLAAASYNAGLGNLLRAQKACGGAVLYESIAACLPEITGRHSAETLGYIRQIRRWRGELQRCSD